MRTYPEPRFSNHNLYVTTTLARLSPATRGHWRILVTGSERWTDENIIWDALDHFANPETDYSVDIRDRTWPQPSKITVITGRAKGADIMAHDWAFARYQDVISFALEEGQYPEPMYKYNNMMLNMCPDLVLAFKWEYDFYDGSAGGKNMGGTEHMCSIASAAGIPVLLNFAPIEGVRTFRSTNRRFDQPFDLPSNRRFDLPSDDEMDKLFSEPEDLFAEELTL